MKNCGNMLAVRRAADCEVMLENLGMRTTVLECSTTYLLPSKILLLRNTLAMPW